MRIALPTIFASLALTGGATAQTSDPGTMIESLFEVIDGDASGQIRRDELMTFNEEMFAAIDQDGNGTVTQEEFLEWGFAFEGLSELPGVQSQYDAVGRMTFDLIDHDNDAGVTEREMGRFHVAMMGYADRDGDGALNLAEFRDHSIYSIVVRTILDVRT